MTRDEFLEEVTTFYDLIDFCEEEHLFDCDGIVDEYSFDEEIAYALEDWRNRFDDWTRARDWLCDLPTGYDFYREDGYGNWEGLDRSDFEDIKQDVLDEMDDAEAWDDEPEEESPDEPEEGEAPISVAELASLLNIPA